MDRDDFYRREAAIREYIKNGRDINNVLRGSKPLDGSSTYTFFNTVRILDKSINESRLKRTFRLFRGISGEYCQKLMEDIEKGTTSISDWGYASFSDDINVARNYALEKKPLGIIFVYESEVGEMALFVDEADCEILFPRKTKFVFIRIREEIIEGSKVIFIYVEREKSETK